LAKWQSRPGSDLGIQRRDAAATFFDWMKILIANIGSSLQSGRAVPALILGFSGETPLPHFLIG